MAGDPVGMGKFSHRHSVQVFQTADDAAPEEVAPSELSRPFSAHSRHRRRGMGMGVVICRLGDPEAKGLVERANGSVEQVTSGGTSFGGSLSPSGTAVAYIDVSEAEQDHHHIVFASEITGGPPRVLAISEGGTWLEHAAWSPDGTQIAFVGYNEMGQTWSIKVVNADGTGRRVIKEPDTLWVYGLAWSPDGSQLAFSGHDQSQNRSIQGIFVIDADGSEPRQLTQPRQPTNIELVQTVHDCCSVAWSPDGSRIAFLRHDANSGAGFASLVTVVADGSDEQVIQGFYVRAYGSMAWHPGG